MSLPCPLCHQPFTIGKDETAFLEKMTFTFGKTVVHPAEPKECPACRLKIRTAHRNERFLYRRKSDLSGKGIVAIFHPEPMRPCTVYAHDEWHSDKWDAITYGRAYDFGRSFFDQFFDLQSAVPKMAVVTVGNENCEFTTGTGYCKNCYLINSSEYCEDCCYGKLFQKCRSCYDCSYIFDSELCSQCFSVYNCYQCRFLSFSKNCNDCQFSLSLLSCKNCFLCSNLERKEYCFRNKQLSKQDYAREIAAYTDSYEKQQEALAELELLQAKSIHRAANILNSEDCTGDYLENSKNCHECFDVSDSQDCTRVTVGVSTKDCFDCSNMYIKPELCFMTLGTIEAYNTAYSLYVFHSQNILYSENCFHSKDLFGCCGLKHKQYCILNTQYTKQEYEELVPRIIEHMKKTPYQLSADGAAMNPSGASGSWGQYFPQHFSPFGYNESVAHEYMPLTKEEATAMGFHWRETKDEIPEAKKIIAARDLPDRTSDVPDDVLNWAITCCVSGRPYKLQKAELNFYRQQSLPIPREHPDVRYDHRMRLKNARTLWQRTCDKCGKKTMSTFAEGRSERIYCEECYSEAAG